MYSFYSLIRFLGYSSLLLISCSGCAAILGANQQVEFILPQEQVNLRVSNSENSTTKEFTNVSGKAEGKLSNFSESYLITVTKPGYRTNTIPVSRTRFNKFKILDIGIPFLADVFFLSGSRLSDPYQASLFFAGTVGWTGILAGSWKVYPKQLKIPALEELPKHQEGERKLLVDKVKILLEGGSYRHIYFEDYKSYVQDRSMHITARKESIINDNHIGFRDELNYQLYQYAFLDTSRYTSFNLHNKLKLWVDVIQVDKITAGNLSRMEVLADWKLLNLVGDEVLVKEKLSGKSNWKIYEAGEEENILDLTAEALNFSMIDFIKKEAVSKFLDMENNSFEGEYDRWPILSLSSDSSQIKSIEGALPSVVTVKTSHGHGSGFFIADGGYLITNFHITGNMPSVSILLANGTLLEGKLIRANPEVDLSLVKVEGVKIPALPLVTDTKEIGSEVFAIGTPNNLEFSQTVTKGIISGKRMINDVVYIQTDVKINPGSSGGALVNKEGAVLGVVNAKLVGKGIEGIGFAISAENIEEALKVSFD